MELSLYDWKKAAAQAATDSSQLELAFMDLSFGFISQKAGPLLQDPYRLGFEIVYSNEDNSKMAGLYAFRVGNQLFSVPCFFITGEVKGTELLYQHGVKMFCPLNTKWAEHIINKHEKSVEGTGHPKDMTNKMMNGMQLERLANPFHSKMASETKSAWEELFEEMEKSAASVSSIETPGLLRDFLIKEDMAMEKLAKAIDISFPFAEAVAHLPEEVWAPSLTDEEIGEMRKSASEALRCDFTLLRDNFHVIKSAAESEIYNAHKRGWTLIDNRAEMQPETKCVAFEENMAEVDQVGFFDLLCTDMEYRKAFVGYEMQDNDGTDFCLPIGHHSEKNLRKVVLFCGDNYYKECRSGSLVGQPCDDENSKWYLNEALEDVPKSGGYVAVNTDNGGITTPFQVLSTKTREDGVVIIRVQRMGSGKIKEWLLNKDYPQTKWTRYNYDDNCQTIFGASIKFHKVKTKKETWGDECCYAPSAVGTATSSYCQENSPYTPGDKDLFWAYLANAGAKKVTLECKETEDVCNTYEVNINGVRSTETDPAVLTVKLASSLAIHVSEALGIVDGLEANQPFSFISFGDPDMVKEAASIRIMDEPNFSSDYDSDLGVARDTTQRFVLNSETTQPVPPASRYGDGYDPTSGNRGNMITQAAQDAGFDSSMLFSKSPEELASMAQQGGVTSLVDPGIVGMLLSTYNSATMVLKYIPKLLEGLDHFGRLLFLFRWKPADFEKMYGSDDMTNLEDNLVSQFLSQGDIVLELIERSSEAGSSAPL